MLRLQQAAEILGITDAAICTGAKYQSFKHSTDNCRVTFFDVEGYLKKEADIKELKEKTTLFIEYLRYEEDIKYSFISKMTGVYTQSISNHDFSPQNALKILLWFAIHRPFHFKRFDTFYSYKHIPRKSVRLLG